jgi:hypothetical protein
MSSSHFSHNSSAYKSIFALHSAALWFFSHFLSFDTTIAEQLLDPDTNAAEVLCNCHHIFSKRSVMRATFPLFFKFDKYIVELTRHEDQFFLPIRGDLFNGNLMHTAGTCES